MGRVGFRVVDHMVGLQMDADDGLQTLPSRSSSASNLHHVVFWDAFAHMADRVRLHGPMTCTCHVFLRTRVMAHTASTEEDKKQLDPLA